MNVSPENCGTVKINQNFPPSYPYKTSYVNGDTVKLEAVASPGYVFQSWSGSYTDKNNPLTITMDCSKNIVANFIQSESSPTQPKSYLLTINIDGSGATTPPAGTHSYTEKTAVSIKAVADKGWKFENWTGSVADPQSPATTVILDADKTCTANFSRITRTLTIQVNGNGTVTPPTGNHIYDEGMTTTITATPEKGWKFDGWTGDIADIKTPTTTILIDTDKVCTANFSRVIFSPWRIAGIIAGIIIIGVAIWSIIRRRAR